MSDLVLDTIGRRHSADDIRRAMDEVRTVGFPHVNMDLIAGLPEDTVETFRQSLDEVLSMGADNITVHTLSLKKGSRLTLEGSRIPAADEVSQMLDYSMEKLRANGFAPYYLYRQKYMSGSFENVGWTKEGGEGLYNIYIMEELHSILSLGAGGSTKMVGGGNICRAFNAKYPKEYIELRDKRESNLAEFAAFYDKLRKDGLL
jgi:oxygen-independent coproporphyrinogen-3 oxidase